MSWRTRLVFRCMVRKPDFVLPHMHRWWIIPRNSWFNVYVHHIISSDNDGALHDHEYASISLELQRKSGTILTEHTIAQGGSHRYKTIPKGATIFRSPWMAHELLLAGDEPSVWTLFITGPRIRTWGFHTENGWVPYQAFHRARKNRV